MFSRNVTAQSHLDLKVWSCHTLRNELLGTASVNLSNVLKNNGGKSMYGAGVADVIHLWVWGRDMKAGISLMWRINLVDPFPPGPGAAVTLLPVRGIPGVLRKLRAALCLYCGTLPSWSRALRVGMQ